MKIDEILAEMPNLTPKELDAIRAKSYELEVQAIKQRLENPNAKLWPPQGDPKWERRVLTTATRPLWRLIIDVTRADFCVSQ